MSQPPRSVNGSSRQMVTNQGTASLGQSNSPAGAHRTSAACRTRTTGRSNVNARASQLLKRIQASTGARDKRIAQLSETLKGKDDQVDEWIEYLDDVGTRQLSQCKENAATMATRVSTASKQAEDSSRKVKELHQVSGRVQGALTLVRNVIQQRESVSSVNNYLDNRSFEAAGKCIKQYDYVMVTLRGTDLEDLQHQSPTHAASGGGGDGGEKNTSFDGSVTSGTGTADADPDTTENSFDSVEEYSTNQSSMLMVDPDQVMTSARSRLEDMVKEELSMGSKPDVVMLTKVLVDIGKKKDALEIYAKWVKDRTEAEVKEMVDVELLKLTEGSDHPQSEQSSHLHIVSQVLDRVVHTIEQEEPHVRESFPEGGVSAVIHQLHKVCTGSCDRAIQDFLKRRNIGASSPVAPRHSGGGRDGDPRMMDGTLEGIAHLIACYNLYLVFVESKLTAQAEEDHAATTAVGTSSEHTTIAGEVAKKKSSNGGETEWLRDPSFSKDIRDLLDIYATQQKDYLQLVFKRAYERLVAKIDLDSLDQAGGGSSGGGMFGATFGGLFAKNNREMQDTAGDGGIHGVPIVAAATGQSGMERHTLNFVDDIFRILLVAVHRSSQTRSIPLTKRTIKDISELISGDLLGTLTRRLQGLQSGGPGSSGNIGRRPGGGSASTSPAVAPAASPEATERSLRWADAGLRCSSYIAKMVTEIQRAIQSSFPTAAEREQMAEPLKNLRILADSYNAALKEALRRAAATASEAMIAQADLHTKFVQVQYYDLGKEGLDYMSLNDPWAHSSCLLWTSMLKAYTADLSPENEYSFIQYVVEVMCSQLMGLVIEKEYDQDGGVQLDRDVRAIRDMFAQITTGPIRDKFTQLSQTAAILLVESAADAGEWYTVLSAASKKHLSPQDVASVLQRRRDMTPGMIGQVFR